jgi:ATP-binding cassette subfamily B protein
MSASPREAPERSPELRLTLLGAARRVAPFFAPQRPLLAAVLGLALATAGASALEPLLVRAIFDRLLPSGAGGLALLLLGLLALLLAHEGLAALLDFAGWRVRIHASTAMMEAVVEKLHALPLAWHRRQSVGGVTTKLDRGVTGSVSAFSDVAFQLLPSTVYLAIAAVIMVRLDARLSLVVLAFAPLPAALGAWASIEQRARERALMQKWTRIFARFTETLAGIQVVRSFAQEARESARFLGEVREANARVVRGVARDAGVGAARGAIVALARITALAYGASRVRDGSISVGTLIAFVAYAAALFAPVQALTGLYQSIRRGVVAVETISSILDEEDPLRDAPDAIELDDVRGEIELRDVRFSYPDGEPILDGVSVHVRPGETLALVGPSGAGKTTLVGLLQRHWEPTAGSVRIDGVDVRRIARRSLRACFGVVLQDGTLFSDSVADNLRFGAEGASDDAVRAAAQAAHADGFVSALPDGYDTLVGERGARLSGGQRQRLAIARALLRDPKILILDEATSALDAESEAHVQAGLARLIEGRTTIVIAHRLSTIARADRIAVIDGGRVVESGTHAELLAAGGWYARMVGAGGRAQAEM